MVETKTELVGPHHFLFMVVGPMLMLMCYQTSMNALKAKDEIGFLIMVVSVLFFTWITSDSIRIIITNAKKNLMKK